MRGFREETSSLFMLLGQSSICVISLQIWSICLIIFAAVMMFCTVSDGSGLFCVLTPHTCWDGIDECVGGKEGKAERVNLKESDRERAASQRREQGL
jgi:hypothetical protein